jgi:starch synthase (maltosyl-transferring)
MPADRRARADRRTDPDDGRRRVVVEQLLPEVNEGRFPIKRTEGEAVRVIAHVHADGHDVLAVRLQHRRSGGVATPWIEMPMLALGNDEWEASFTVGEAGAHEYTAEAWVDDFLTWRHGLELKSKAGVDVTVELQEGAALVTAAAERSAPAVRKTRRRAAVTVSSDRDHLMAFAAILGGTGEVRARAGAALDEKLLDLMMRHADRSLSTSYLRVLRVTIDRERARFGAWYEMFPRSWGPTESRSATFAEAALHLPNVAALGFDVVYLPPIHPIGTSFRKGRNNALAAAAGDPGSPWAIGSPAGGHKAVEPGLGTLQDFREFVAASRRVNMEVALDLAYQCSPDHPYVREHPEWFRHRPDGTIKYAENPPKKYQDIYPFDFECADWPALWAELLSVVTFWIEQGVRIFRVDNPHTKPYRFWEWLIAETRRSHPDTIFLSEAFTRPKVMGYLAKLGFTQSYTYFTWRNTQEELVEYFTELTTTPVREYLRPNLFTNTPDILHKYLQDGGPPAFKTRLVLAATLGASYGIYSGFELCENRAVPGTEEYMHSEKYQIRQWDWNRPGHIRELVAAVNRIRREHRALQFDGGLQFHDCDNPHLIAYTKTSPDGDSRLLIVVNLDPRHMQHGFVEVPVAVFGAAGSYMVHDLLSGNPFTWQGDRHYVRLDPSSPAHVLELMS